MESQEAQVNRGKRSDVSRGAKKKLVPAIKRACEVIELIAKEDSGLTISDIHRILRLPLSSTATTLYTLQSLEFLERDPESSRYMLGLKMLLFARRVLDKMDLVGRCHGLLAQLVQESGLTGHLAVMRDGESMYIDRVAGSGLTQFSSYVGMRWPVHISAVGKALLAFLPEPELARVVNQLALNRMTPYTITSKKALKMQLRAFRDLGYCWEMGEGEVGIGCIAAPVFGPNKEILAAASITGTTLQITKANTPALGNLVKRYASVMSARLGGEPSETILQSAAH